MYASVNRECLSVGIQYRLGTKGNGGWVWSVPDGQTTEN
jgi:hypothetical protein